MKQLFLSLIIFCCTLNIYAEKDVTTFLGIPVDGTKEEMYQKLQSKGFVVDSNDPDLLIGEFNGELVKIAFVTNKNKIWRIGVYDVQPHNEKIIKLRFNRLCSQFENNDRYLSPVPHGTYNIPEDEDISYEMTMRNKEYTATFHQKLSNPVDTVDLAMQIKKTLLSEYSEKIDTITDELINDLIGQIVIQKIREKQVWFTLIYHNGQYTILLCYDNLSNRANGEDL